MYVLHITPLYQVSTRRHSAHPVSVPITNPFSAAVPFWGQTAWN